MKKYLRGVSSFLTQNKTKMMTGLAQQLALPIAFLLVNWLLRAAAKPPNIVFFLADDVGFSDISSFGSEIHTPHLEELSRNGIRFSNYHTAATCAPSRGMLNTGVDSHRNGCPNLFVALPSSMQDNSTYRGQLLGPDRVLTVAERLRDAGYSTHISGKWNLGLGKADAFYRGFQRSFSLGDTGSDNYLYKSYLPIYPHPHYYENGQPMDSLPEDFYSTEYIVDRAISFVEADRSSGRPFFSYIGFQAVHIPVQVPTSFSAKYRGKYSEGWHVWREKRFNASIEAGVIPPSAVFKQAENIPKWESLSKQERELQAKAMEVYAGMIEAMDAHIGRFLSFLKEIEEFDNTVFIFTSDNGAEGTDPFKKRIRGLAMKLWLYVQGYTRDVATLGEVNSYNFIGPAWATVAASPLAGYKFNPGEGGLRVPLLFSGKPLGIKASDQGSVRNSFTFATDIATTLIRIAGADTDSPPGVEKMTGRDISGVIKGEKTRVYEEDEPVGYELGGNAALYRGKYKIRVNRGEMGDSKWRLFNIEEDPGETEELQDILPEVFEAMLKQYDEYVVRNGVKEYPPSYDQVKQVARNAVWAYYTFQGSGDAIYVVPLQLIVTTSLAFYLARFCCSSSALPKAKHD